MAREAYCKNCKEWHEVLRTDLSPTPGGHRKRGWDWRTAIEKEDRFNGWRRVGKQKCSKVPTDKRLHRYVDAITGEVLPNEKEEEADNQTADK